MVERGMTAQMMSIFLQYLYSELSTVLVSFVFVSSFYTVLPHSLCSSSLEWVVH